MTFQPTKPIDFAIYKMHGALRVGIMPVSQTQAGYPKAGGYMFTFAPAGGNNQKYSWDKETSVSMFIGAGEAMKVINMLRRDQSIRIYHDPDKGTPQEGTRAKSLYANKSGEKLYLNVSQGERKIGVTFDSDEIDTLGSLIYTTLAQCYGWAGSMA